MPLVALQDESLAEIKEMKAVTHSGCVQGQGSSAPCLSALALSSRLYMIWNLYSTPFPGSFVEFHAGNPLGNSVFAQISVNNAQAQLEDHETGERLQVHCTAVKRHPLENKFPWKCSNQTVWNPINWIKSCGCLMQKAFFCNSCCRHPRQTQPRGGWEGETSPHQPPQQVRSCNLEVKSLKILFSQSFPSLSSTTGSK